MQQLSIPVSVGASGVAAQKPAASTTTLAERKTRPPPPEGKSKTQKRPGAQGGK